MNRLPALLVCSALLVACTGPDPVQPTDTSERTSPSASASADSSASPSVATDGKALPKIDHDAKTIGFTRPKSCDDLLSVLKERGQKDVTAYGFVNSHLAYDSPAFIDGVPDRSVNLGDNAAAEGAVAAEATTSQVEADYSVTNTQEADVGEFADTVTNGKLIATVVWHDARFLHPVGSKIHLISPDSLDNLGTIELGSDAANADNKVAFVDEKTLLVLSSFYNESGPRTRLMRVDVSDPTKPTTTSTVRMSGNYQAARMVGGKVILATTAEPHGLNFTQPKDKSVRGEREALEANKKIIADSTLEQWMADAEILDGNDKPVQENLTVTDCDHVMLSDDNAYFFTSVASIDPSQPIMTLNKGSAVMGYVDGVYASKDRVVTWMYDIDRRAHLDAQLVTFNITKPDAITLGAKGAVRGHLPNSWSFDEEGGILRVASTTYAGDSSGKTESRVTIFQEQGEDLVPVGKLTGLGKDEEIKSIRWLTPELGVMVTFRQTDPVYTIDTTDPTKPKSAGELKIPGYSAYLHPVAKDRLLGIGQHADPKTGQALGFKYSLFDISDLSAPKELDTREFIGAESKAEYDHQAFTWHKDRGYLAMADNRSNDGQEGREDHLTVSGVAVKDDKIELLGKGELKTRDAFGGANTVVIGEHVYAVNPSAIGKFKASDITEEKQRFLP